MDQQAGTIDKLHATGLLDTDKNAKGSAAALDAATLHLSSEPGAAKDVRATSRSRWICRVT